METIDNKPTLSDLCSAASLYYQTFQHLSGVPYTIPKHITDEVNKLHHVMDGINKEDVHNWLFKKDDKKGLICQYDFIKEDPIDLVKRTKEALWHVWEEIRDNGEIIEQIDSRCDEVWEFCETWASWLEQLLPLLENLRQVAYDTTPTDKEKRWLRFLLTWDIGRWLKVFIDSNSSLSLLDKKRLLKLALTTKGIDDNKKVKLNEALMQIEKQINEKQQAAAKAVKQHDAREKVIKTLRDKQVPKEQIDQFIEDFPVMDNKTFVKWWKRNLADKMYRAKFYQICMDMGCHLKADGTPEDGWSKDRIMHI